MSIAQRKHEFIFLFEVAYFYGNQIHFLSFFDFFFSLFCACRYTKPQTFADCVGDELPLGWEESYDQIIGRYYINHFDREFHLANFPIFYLHYNSH